ncbi:hypothetical protein DL96DRAFT_1587265, partial [Flagelloscypha sp. PMI_526]
MTSIILPRNLPDIPEDILHEIIEYTQITETLVLSLVNHALCAVSRRRLFHTIQLRTAYHVENLHRTLISCPDIAPFIRNVTIFHASLRALGLPDLLEQLRDLRSLTMEADIPGLNWSRSLSARAHAVFKTIMPGLENFELRNFTDVDLQTLLLLSSVQTLTLNRVSFLAVDDKGFEAHDINMPFPLESLYLGFNSVVAQPSEVRALALFLQAAQCSVRTLQFDWNAVPFWRRDQYQITTFQAVGFMIQPISLALVSLDLGDLAEISTVGISSLIAALDLSSCLPNLKRLAFRVIILGSRRQPGVHFDMPFTWKRRIFSDIRFRDRSFIWVTRLLDNLSAPHGLETIEVKLPDLVGVVRSTDTVFNFDGLDEALQSQYLKSLSSILFRLLPPHSVSENDLNPGEIAQERLALSLPLSSSRKIIEVVTWKDL